MVKNDVIVSIVQKITERNEPPCKKTLQKIVFLIEAKQIDLGCDYGIHFYGPYSSDLDFAVRELNEDGILEIDYTGTGHKISVNSLPVTMNAYADDPHVIEIIDEFGMETPGYLELLTTALYVYHESNKQASTILAGVQKIKGGKYSSAEIEKAVLRLQKTGYIA